MTSEDETIIEEESYIPEEEEPNNQKIGSEPDKDKQAVVEELYNTEQRVRTLINSWSGNDKEDAIAGRRFLNNQFSALVGVINTTNAFTKKNGDETRAILYRAVKAFIVDVVNEPTIHRTNYYSLCFTYWHCLELFLGLPRNGHGANVLRDALAGLNTQVEEEQKQKTFSDKVFGAR